MAFNPVAKNNKNKGGAFKTKDREGKSYISQKIKKELEEIDEKWIEEEINDTVSKRNESD